MAHHDKVELIAYIGAIYAFVAYLTAFTLEVVFIVDLTRQNEQISSPIPLTSSSQPDQTTQIIDSIAIQTDHRTAFDMAQTYSETMRLEMLHHQATLSCLAVSILYLVVFIASLFLIVALIIRSTFILFIWLCLMAIIYLPEFGFVIYVSIYAWGLESLNGQSELLFYLLRATLNVIFIYRVYKLFKIWNYEKNFFMFTSKTNSSLGSRFNSIGGYDSPYYIGSSGIGGESLSTTINPIFSTSTMSLNNRTYDNPDFRDSTCSYLDYKTNLSSRQPVGYANQHASSNGRSQAHKSIISPVSSMFFAGFYRDEPDSRQSDAQLQQVQHSSRPRPRKKQSATNCDNPQFRQPTEKPARGSRQADKFEWRESSLSSINDVNQLSDCELDLDYRTLTNQRHYVKPSTSRNGNRYWLTSAALTTETPNNQLSSLDRAIRRAAKQERTSLELNYSTQSLDRRYSKGSEPISDGSVTLRPLGHQPFEYLKRPGSTSNLSAINLRL